MTFLGLGSNIGDKYANLMFALDELSKHPHIWIRKKSFIYESKPMYVHNQPNYYNMVIEIDTNFEAFELLDYIKKIEIKKKLDFGVADVVVAIPDDWIDVQTVADLEEVSFDFRDKKNTRLRVATKYPNLTNNFLVSKGITQYKLVPSLGATETYPFIGSSEIITDITSTGKTLKDNNLRVLKDGCILNSQACLLISKKKAATLRPFLNSLI